MFLHPSKFSSCFHSAAHPKMLNCSSSLNKSSVYFITTTVTHCTKQLVSSSNLILVFLVILLSRHFFEGAGEGKRQNSSFVLFGHFFHVRKLLGVFKNPCQIKTENKDSVCAYRSTERILADWKNSLWTTSWNCAWSSSNCFCTKPAHQPLWYHSTVCNCSLKHHSVHYDLCCSAYKLSFLDTVFQ